MVVVRVSRDTRTLRTVEIYYDSTAVANTNVDSREVTLRPGCKGPSRSAALTWGGVAETHGIKKGGFAAAVGRCVLSSSSAAETVISTLEDAEDYQAFEAAVTSDYEAESAGEREFVLRLAGILCRLRLATGIVPCSSR